jgi:hypothetical protein
MKCITALGRILRLAVSRNNDEQRDDGKRHSRIHANREQGRFSVREVKLDVKLGRRVKFWFTGDGRYAIALTEHRLSAYDIVKDKRVLNADHDWGAYVGALSPVPPYRFVIPDGGPGFDVYNIEAVRVRRQGVKMPGFNQEGTLAFSPDGRQVLSAGGALQLTDISLDPPQTRRLSDGEWFAASYSPSGCYIAAVERRYTGIWDARQEQPVQIRRVDVGISDCYDFPLELPMFTCGDQFVVGSHGSIPVFAGAALPTTLANLNNSHASFRNTTVVSADGELVAVSGALLNPRSNQQRCIQDLHVPGTFMTFSPDNQTLVIGDYFPKPNPCCIFLEYLDDPDRPALQLQQKGQGIFGVAVSPDSRYVLVAGYEKAFLWDFDPPPSARVARNGVYGTALGRTPAPDSTSRTRFDCCG